MTSRLYLVDGLRTVCALVIVLLHYRDFFLNPVVISAGFTIDTPRLQGLYPFADLVTAQGHWMVEVFWAISGFIFAHVYGRARAITGRAFFLNRFSRLYPLHLATLLWVASLHIVALQVYGHAMEGRANTVENFGLNLLFISAWPTGATVNFNTPVWSVSVEIAVYIVFFLALRGFGVSTRSMLGMALASLALVAVTDNDIPVCAAYFFLAATGFCVLQHLERMAPRARRLAVAGLCALSVLPALIGQVVPAMPLTLIVASPIVMGLILLAMLEHRLPKAPAVLESFGDITYSTYLLHIPMQQTFLLTVMAGWVAPGVLVHPLAPWIYLGLVIVAGHLCFRHFERPMQNWIRRLARGQ